MLAILFLEGTKVLNPDTIPFYISKNEILSTPEEKIVEKVFKHYREKGFPYFNLSDSEKRQEFASVSSFPCLNIIKNDIITQTMHGLALAWSYFPHSWSVRCNTSISCMEVFKNDYFFKTAIKKILKRSDRASDNEVRKALKYVTQGVSNFRPTVARYVYETYSGDGVVWDMSSGFGGRLLGAMTSVRLKHYIGTDPSSPAHNGLVKFKEDYENDIFHGKSKFISPDKIKIDLHKLGSEEFLPEKATLDLCFTSPPYFNCEKYSDEETQSYIKFPEQNAWMNDFLGQTLSNCHHGLKSNGTLIINLADVKSYPNLCKDFLRLTKKCGFELEKTLRMTLSNIQGGNEKYEPMFIFKKV